MKNSFDLYEERFVSWRDLNGAAVDVGLRELFARAGEMTSIGDAGPQSTFAVIRVLLVLMHQTKPGCDDGYWQKLWAKGAFPEDWLIELDKAAKGNFDLFDAKRPFYQRVQLETERTDEDKYKTPAYLISEFAAGTNINHASHTYDAAVVLCPACCARGLLQLPPFCGAGGSGLMASINNTPPVYTAPVGPSLFHTLLINWPLADRVPGDHPQWIVGKASDRIGLLEGLTWEPRTVRLLPVANEGSACTNCGTVSPLVVRRIAFRKGVVADQTRLAEWRDPHVCYERIAVGQKIQTRTLAAPEPDKRPEAALGFWRRVIATLLRVQDSGEIDVECRAVSYARGRTKDLQTGVAVSCVVPFTRPGQDKKHIVRGGSWTIPILDDDLRQQLLAELDWFSDGLEAWDKQKDHQKGRKETPLPALALRAEFERRAEMHFRALLDRLGDHPAHWREAVRDDLEHLIRPVSSPGKALETVRAHRAIADAIVINFPLPGATT